LEANAKKTQRLVMSREHSTGKYDDRKTGDKYKNTNHQQMHKEGFIINRNTLLHVSTLLGNLQGELFCYRYTNVALYS
jgi:hypothetical protein